MPKVRPHTAAQSWCVTSKDDVVSFDVRIVAGKARLVLRLVDRLPVEKSTESPPPRGGIPFGVLDHDLNGCCRPRDECSVDLGRGNAFPSQLHQDGAIWEWEATCTVCPHRRGISEDNPELVQPTGFLSHANRLPLPITGRNADTEDRRLLEAVRRRGRRTFPCAGHSRVSGHDHAEKDSSHAIQGHVWALHFGFAPKHDSRAGVKGTPTRT